MSELPSHMLSVMDTTTVPDNVDRLTAERDTDFRLQCAMEYARCNLQRDLSLRRLARVTNVSVSHMCRLFREEFGTSPAHCVKLLRLRTAAHLLASTSLSVKEVMVMVGINDASHFVRDFRNYSGDFPVEYRARTRKRAHWLSDIPQDGKIG